MSGNAAPSGALARQVRMEVRLLWRGFVLPVSLLIFALLAVSNVLGAASSVRADYALVQHTRAEYAANGMDFAADLRKPEGVTTKGNEQSVTNLARFDYDNMASAVVSLSPSSSVPETLKYFGFLIFPLAFFLLGLWLATGQRRYHLEKVTLVRAGPSTTVLARQLALLAAAAVIIVVLLLVDVVARAISQSVLAGQLPLSAFVPLSPLPAQNVVGQWGIIALVVLFFGGAGVAIGSVTGVFAIPAIVFLIWDYVVPFLGAHDPRNWFNVLGHAVFTYGSGFQLSAPIPLDHTIALCAAVGGALVFLGLGYLGIRIRNPLAT